MNIYILYWVRIHGEIFLNHLSQEEKEKFEGFVDMKNPVLPVVGVGQHIHCRNTDKIFCFVLGKDGYLKDACIIPRESFETMIPLWRSVS